MSETPRRPQNQGQKDAPVLPTHWSFSAAPQLTALPTPIVSHAAANARVGARRPFFVFCLHLFPQKAQNPDGQNFTGEGKGAFPFTCEVLKSPESSRVSFPFSTHCG